MVPMSKVFRALEKAEQEKQAKPVWEGPLIETLDVKSIEPQNGGSKLKDLAKDIETFDLPLKDEESIPFAGTGTFAIEQFRKLKTHIFRITPNPPRCILITSTVPQEGKTMVTMNLAMSIAQELHKKVIVIDADLRRPSLYPIKFNNRKGLSDYLANETPIADILKSFDSEKFVVIPAGSPSSNPAELISSKKMKELIATMREFEEDTHILIDSPPILSTSEPLILSEWVDGIVFVIKADQATRGSIKKAIDSVAREKILGIVFNNKDLKPSKIYSDYYDRYYKK